MKTLLIICLALLASCSPAKFWLQSKTVTETSHGTFVTFEGTRKLYKVVDTIGCRINIVSVRKRALFNH